MRKIHYIFIVSDTETHDNKSGHYGKSDLRHQPSSLFAHHFIVNSEGLVIPGTDIHQPVHLGLGTRNLDREPTSVLNVAPSSSATAAVSDLKPGS